MAEGFDLFIAVKRGTVRCNLHQKKPVNWSLVVKKSFSKLILKW